MIPKCHEAPRKRPFLVWVWFLQVPEHVLEALSLVHLMCAFGLSRLSRSWAGTGEEGTKEQWPCLILGTGPLAGAVLETGCAENLRNQEVFHLEKQAQRRRGWAKASPGLGGAGTGACVPSTVTAAPGPAAGSLGLSGSCCPAGQDMFCGSVLHPPPPPLSTAEEGESWGREGALKKPGLVGASWEGGSLRAQGLSLWLLWGPSSSVKGAEAEAVASL